MWDSFIEAVTKVNDWVNGVVWGLPMIIMILGTGILLTVRTRVLQVRKFGESMSSTIVPAVKDMKKSKKGRDKKAVSQFEAFSAAISGTVGTGNIIGVTSAILTGGPGAVLWMWISAFFGMVTNYSENVLGLYYRKKEKDGSFSGGAFYYIAYGIKQRWLGMLAAIFCLLAAVGMSGVQTNKITGSYTSVLNNDSAAVKLIIGGIVAFLAAVVIIGGIKRIGRIASMLVPFMSLLFIAMAFVIIGKNYTAIPDTFRLIFTSAFSSKAVAGGVGGFAFSQIIKKGLARGVFSNEAGLGTSAMAHSASDNTDGVKQSLYGIFEVFTDTVVICTLTALTVLCSGIYINYGATASTELVNEAFSVIYGDLSGALLALMMCLFGLSSVIGWGYYGTVCCSYVFGNKGKRLFVFIYPAACIIGAVCSADTAWRLSAFFNGIMLCVNTFAVMLLSSFVNEKLNNFSLKKV